MDPAVFWCTVRPVVGISGIRQGQIVAERYRVIERLTRFAVADSALTGVEYEYWLALDETRGVEVWLQVAESRDVFASGAQLAGVISSLRRLNHPAVPAVLDFGELEVVVEDVDDDDEVEDAYAGDESDDVDGLVAAVGYVVLEPVEAESLATVLLRGALTEAEILAVLIGIADVLKVLHEVELVHGHLSAYSFLLGERSVLLVDLAAALALEVASSSELTPAADVYALAWLACIALAGVDAVEAEFGVGYDAGSSPESLAAPQLLTIDLVERRRAWAETNLVATYGLRAELAALLVAALGEASGRPTVSELATALRRREDVTAAAGAAAVGAAAAGAAVLAVGAVVAGEEAAEAIEAVEVAEAVEVVEAEEAEEEVEAAEAIEAAEVGVVGAAAAVASVGVVEATEVVEVAESEVVEASEASRTSAFVGAGVGVGMGIGAEALSAGARGGRGSGGTATAVASAPITPVSSPAGRHGSPPRRPRSAFYVALGIVVLVVGGVAWGCAASGSPASNKPAAPAGTPTGVQTSGGQAGAGTGASPSATAGQTAGAGVSPSATAASPSGAATESAGASASSQAGSGATPGYTATPLATVPAGPSQAVQQIQQTVSQAESAGQIPQQAQGSLNQAVSTIQQEIGSGLSVQRGINELQSALSASGVPSGFVTQLNELIPYLVAHQGS